MLHAVLVTAAEEAAPNPLLPATYDIIWSAVCFAIILIFFWKFGLPKMQIMLDQRAEAIEGNIAKADEAQRKAEAALEEYTAQLAEARKEAALTQHDLSVKLGVTRGTIVRLEAGEAVSMVVAMQAIRAVGRDVALVPRFSKLQVRP